MKKMRKSSSRPDKQTGFTLLELMLVMAIMVLFISFIYGTFYIVNASHARVAVLNDAKEVAALQMTAIENMIINADDVVISDSSSALADHTVITFDAEGNLTYNGTPAFTIDQYKIKTTSDNKNKWDVTATFAKSAATSSVVVTVIIKDRSKDPPTVFYKLEKTILLLNVKNEVGSDITAGITGRVIKCKYPTF
jgi:prepilin-type N-terminal cleavage/methylation domain-containing protein